MLKMLIVLLIIVVKIVWQRLIKLLIAATLFVYFYSLTFVNKRFKYLYIILSL